MPISNYTTLDIGLQKIIGKRPYRLGTVFNISKVFLTVKIAQILM